MGHRQTIVVVAATIALLACTESIVERVPTKLAVVTAPSSAAINRSPLPTQPSVRLEDDEGNAIARAGVEISVSLGTSSGTLDGTTTATTDPNGLAAFSGLSIRGAAGAKTLTFSAAGLTSANATVTTTGGAPAAMAQHAGDNQIEAEGIPVTVRPAVKVTDADGNGSPGVAVTFEVTGGGGSLTGTAQTTDANGIAAVGSWTLGAEGANTLTATASGLTAPATFVANAVHLPVASVVVTAAATSALLPNATRQFTAAAVDSVGRPLAGRAFTWASGTTSIATVSSTGLATAVLPGTSSISATSEGKTGSATLSVIAPTLTAQASLTGHFGANFTGAPPAPFQYGFSNYSSIHTLNTTHTQYTQLGWGFWMMPENLSFTDPLCPVGTTARDNFTDRAPTWRDVYQTIEGGVGEWGSTRFPSTVTKFRINGTPDCYDTQVASTGWHFYGTLLGADKLGLAQLSNRLLVPPDGFTFTGGATMFGNAWFALPLIPAYTASNGLAVGDQSWTLFVNAANFKGPVAFYTPEVWTRVHLTDPTGRGRSFDARPMFTGGVAIEMGTLYYFTGTGPDGTRYRRIPRLTFPVDGSGKSIIQQDLRWHSRAAIWDAVQDWIDVGDVPASFDPAGSMTAPITSSFNLLKLSGDPVTFSSAFDAGATTNAASQPAFGMWWGAGGIEPGVFPEYFKEVSAGQWTPVTPADVPRVTWLADQKFALQPKSSFPQVDISATSLFSSANWSAGPFTVTLNDGSRVDYVWYKFVDQPAIARLGLSSTVRDKLQTFAESLHQNWGINGLTIDPPSSGTLATFDAALIVTPPAALSKGYVPVVIRQY